MNSLFGSNKTTMVAAADAMPGRDRYTDEVPKLHAILGTPLQGLWTPTSEVLYLGMGCFWGAERKFWQSAASSQPPSATKADSRHTQPMKRHVLQNGSHRSRHGCVRTERDLEGLPPLG